MSSSLMLLPQGSEGGWLGVVGSAPGGVWALLCGSGEPDSEPLGLLAGVGATSGREGVEGGESSPIGAGLGGDWAGVGAVLGCAGEARRGGLTVLRGGNSAISSPRPACGVREVRRGSEAERGLVIRSGAILSLWAAVRVEALRCSSSASGVAERAGFESPEA